MGQTGIDYGSPEGRAWRNCIGDGGVVGENPGPTDPGPCSIDTDGDGKNNCDDGDNDDDGREGYDDRDDDGDLEPPEDGPRDIDDDNDGRPDTCNFEYREESDRWVVSFEDNTASPDMKDAINDVGGTVHQTFPKYGGFASASLTDSQKDSLSDKSIVTGIRREAVAEPQPGRNTEADCRSDPDPDVPNDRDWDPEDVDTDGDGETNDEDTDIDGDGTNNGNDPDDDGDGIPDSEDPDPKIPNEVERTAYYELTVSTPDGTIGPKPGLVMGECVGDESNGPFYGNVSEYSNYTAQDCQLFASYNDDAKLINNGSTIRVGAVFRGGNRTTDLDLNNGTQTIRPANVDRILDRASDRAANVDSILGSTIPESVFGDLFGGGGGGIDLGNFPGPSEAPIPYAAGGIGLLLYFVGGRG
jgi:hypothetical protein